MFVSGWRRKTRKIIIPFSVPFYESLVSLKENTDRKKKKETRKKEREKTIRIEHKPNGTLLTLCIM